MSNRDESLLDDVIGASAEMLPVIGPYFGLAARRLSGKIREEHERNVSTALAAAERISGRRRDDLAEELLANPALIPLLTRLLYAAGMNGCEETLIAMGAALGDAVREPGQVDETGAILAALSDLGRVHIAVLRALASKPDGEGWATQDVVRDVGGSVPSNVVGLCLGGLDGAGLIERGSGFGAIVHEITDLGRTVLELLDAVASGGDAT